MSLTDSMQPRAPCTTCASGAAASQSFIAPHSSASMCANEIQRSLDTGITWDTASLISGKSPRMPVW